MKLIFLYGPPAVGKLTVAKELSRLTGYPLFHNHMVLNDITEIFGYQHPVRRKLTNELRLRIFQEAITADVNLIVTAIIMRDNEKYFQQMLQMVRQAHGEFFLVRLTATKESLLQRVTHESRTAHNKINSQNRLEEYSQQYPEVFNQITNENQLLIDTTTLSPRLVAKQIIEHYKLKNKDIPGLEAI